ncbi:hypothetical protein CG51_06065 [Haematobacter missouriensis]|nr:hypothetical protein CG51_06065 [Haematobacter missouriensis]
MFLLTYIGVDPDYLATHDLGRAHGAGSNRAKKLADTGAAAAFARHRISYLHFLKLAGHLRSEFAEVAASDEMEQWHHFLGAEVRK